MSISDRLSLRRLKIPTKLIILVGVIGVVAVVMAVALVRQQLSEIGSLRDEQGGLRYLRQLHSTFQHLQQHRSAASMALLDNSPQGDLQQLRSVLATDFETLAATDQQLGGQLTTNELFATIQRNWRNVSTRFDQFDERQSYDAHSRLLDDVVDLALAVGEGSGLRTTSDLASFYLTEITMARLLEVSEETGKLQARGLEVAAYGPPAVELRQELANRTANIAVGISAIERSLELAFAQGFGLRQQGEAVWQTADNRVRVFLAFIDQEILRELPEGEVLQVSPAGVLEAGNQALTALYAVANVELDSLEERLTARLGRLQLLLGLTLGGLAIGFLVSGLLAFFIARGLTRQLGMITATLTQIGIGNFEARSEIVTEDELGTVARSLNGMLANTLALIQSREERDTQQKSIMKLLDEVSDVAQGDLTRDAEVTPEITGAIADAFNFMISELRRLVGDIQDTAEQVGDAAVHIQTTTESLAEGSDSQSRRIIDASETIRSMAGAMQGVSANAVRAAEVARIARSSSLRGAQAVTQTAKGMISVRQEVQETSKRIKRLGETSQEIGEIAKLINEIADRTGMLALNASIQAASAGEAGRGFAVVAAEVERLAVRAADATKQIDELIKTIQGETNEVVIAMEETTREVVNGSTLASEAGQTLTEIEEVSNELADLVESISDASTSQAGSSEQIAQAMADISGISQSTASGSRDAAESVQGLAALVGKLRDSVSTFKLPADAA